MMRICDPKNLGSIHLTTHHSEVAKRRTVTALHHGAFISITTAQTHQQYELQLVVDNQLLFLRASVHDLIVERAPTGRLFGPS